MNCATEGLLRLRVSGEVWILLEGVEADQVDLDRHIVLLVHTPSSLQGDALSALQVDDQCRRQFVKGNLLCHALTLLLTTEESPKSLFEGDLTSLLLPFGLSSSCQASFLGLLALAAFLSQAKEEGQNAAAALADKPSSVIMAKERFQIQNWQAALIRSSS